MVARAEGTFAKVGFLPQSTNRFCTGVGMLFILKTFSALKIPAHWGLIAGKLQGPLSAGMPPLALEFNQFIVVRITRRWRRNAKDPLTFFRMT